MLRRASGNVNLVAHEKPGALRFRRVASQRTKRDAKYVARVRAVD